MNGVLYRLSQMAKVRATHFAVYVNTNVVFRGIVCLERECNLPM